MARRNKSLAQRGLQEQQRRTTWTRFHLPRGQACQNGRQVIQIPILARLPT